ncbi:TBC1 domain family member 13 [Nematocida sp. AWRm77]|nr:TBC1 domain family member 13 [Nematocida sp. AWRm77]
MNRKRAREWAFSLGVAPKDASANFFQGRQDLYLKYQKEAEVSVPAPLVVLIDKDMQRTRVRPLAPHTPSTASKTNLNNKGEGKGGSVGEGECECEGVDSSDFLSTPDGTGTCRETVSRILRVYAATNRTIGYVQGMNTICSIIYYVLWEEYAEYAESVAYFCFFNLMVDLGDLYSEKMDSSLAGTTGHTAAVLRLLQACDRKLYLYIVQIRLFSLSSFHLKWMFLLFSSEFSLADTLRLWDVLFKAPKKTKHLPYLCAAVFVLLRSAIIGQPLHAVLSTLQNTGLAGESVLRTSFSLAKKHSFPV